AIALKPELVILDEPTAALDVSVQAVVLNLLQELKDSLGMSYLFVSHDLNVVRLLCDRVIVMRAGKIVETGPTEQVLFAPQAQYPPTLLPAIPPPNSADRPAGRAAAPSGPAGGKNKPRGSPRPSAATPHPDPCLIRSTISSRPAPAHSIWPSTNPG